jgi:hypothetical protein
MKVEDILEAEFEAKRFLERVKDFKKAHPDQFSKKPTRLGFYTSKEGGALKRSSMDLTRSLAKLRKT